jgi:hypothetical protein
MAKVYPIDINGINNIGVEEWLENYYVPVTGKEFKNIYDKVFKSYMDIIKEYDNRIIYWIAISNIRIPHYVSLYISDLLGFVRLKEKGYEYIIGQKIEEIPDSTSMVHYLYSRNKSLIIKDLAEIAFQGRAKNILRTIKHNIKPLSLHGVSFAKNISNLCYIVGNRYLKEVVSFCDESNIAPVYLSPMLFAKKGNNHYGGNFKTSGLIEFVNKFLDIVRNQYAVINNTVFECLQKEINEMLRLSYLVFCHNVKVFSKFKPKKLLLTSLGNPIHRIFSSAWRYAGGEVVGLSHGNTYSNHYSDRIFIELSAVDVFVSTSRGHKEIVRQAVDNFAPDFRNCKIISSKNNIYKPLFGRLQSDPPVNKIKKIMVIGYIIDNCVAIDAEYHTFARLYHQLEIVKLLKGSGFYVIYKPRFEMLTEIKGIFEAYADEVIIDRFEDVYHSADCLLFSAPYSTTFGFSLLTNKPIVLINIKGNPWYPRAFELVKERCAVVKAETVDGKIVFNEQDVLNAVQESINNINYDILYEFAF